MAATDESNASLMQSQGDMRGVKDELHRLDGQLRILVCAYEEDPSAIDVDLVKGASSEVYVKNTITRIYRTMQGRVFACDSPFRADHDLWEAFAEQREEFTEFYDDVLGALETHEEIVRYYRLVRDESQLFPRHGVIEGMREDRRAYLADRNECIMAVRNFGAKFSAMLTILNGR